MNEKIAVIYKTKYQSTKKYAGWIAIKLEADLYELSDFREKDIDKYSTIIYGGGVYAGKINGIDFINKNIEKLKDKRLYIFTVGMDTRISSINKLIENNLDINEYNDLKIFNFRGNLEYSKLKLVDKLIIKGLRSVITKKAEEELDESEKIILESADKDIELCDKRSINKLIDYVEI